MVNSITKLLKKFKFEKRKTTEDDSWDSIAPLQAAAARVELKELEKTPLKVFRQENKLVRPCGCLIHTPTRHKTQSKVRNYACQVD